MSLWKDQFAEALRSYVATVDPSMSQDPASVYSAVQALELEQRRGIWEAVGHQLGISARAAHNHYHNVYIKQFFADPNPFRQELYGLISQNMLRSGASLNSERVIQEFISRHPDKKFYRRQLQQIIGIQKQRMVKQPRRARASLRRQSVSCDSMTSQEHQEDEAQPIGMNWDFLAFAEPVQQLFE